MKAIKNEWKIGNKKNKEELLARKEKEMKIKMTGWERGCEENHTRRKHKKNEREGKKKERHK